MKHDDRTVLVGLYAEACQTKSTMRPPPASVGKRARDLYGTARVAYEDYVAELAKQLDEMDAD